MNPKTKLPPLVFLASRQDSSITPQQNEVEMTPKNNDFIGDLIQKLNNESAKMQDKKKNLLK